MTYSCYYSQIFRYDLDLFGSLVFGHEPIAITFVPFMVANQLQSLFSFLPFPSSVLREARFLQSAESARFWYNCVLCKLHFCWLINVNVRWRFCDCVIGECSLPYKSVNFGCRSCVVVFYGTRHHPRVRSSNQFIVSVSDAFTTKFLCVW